MRALALFLSHSVVFVESEAIGWVQDEEEMNGIVVYDVKLMKNR